MVLISAFRRIREKMDLKTRILSIALGMLFCLPCSKARSAGGEVHAPDPPKATRLLLIEGEDLGMAHSIDKASFEALEKGWITSVGVLTPAPWFPEVVRWSRSHPSADVGLQLDLNAEWASYRWRPVSSQPSLSGLLDPAGYLPNNASYIALHAKPEEIEAEFRAQIDTVTRAALTVTHIDAHGGIVFYTPTLFREYWRAVSDSGIPGVLAKDLVLQRGKPNGTNTYDLGGVQIDISKVPIDHILQMEPGCEPTDWLNCYKRMLGGLTPGAYLLHVHLGHDDEELRAITVDHPNWGAKWRQSDLDVVSNPEFQSFLREKGFTLITWRDLMKMLANASAESRR
jgi:predicted glycoside hydrolase/deacetylase ChbG (UPF0249 family)